MARLTLVVDVPTAQGLLSRFAEEYRFAQIRKESGDPQTTYQLSLPLPAGLEDRKHHVIVAAFDLYRRDLQAELSQERQHRSDTPDSDDN